MLLSTKILLVFFVALMVVAWRCYFAEREPTPLGAVAPPAAGTGQLPRPQTPYEALQLILEGNARYVHGELWWAQSTQEPPADPVALLVNATEQGQPSQSIFDLPQGMLTEMRWATNRDCVLHLDTAVKLVLLLAGTGSTASVSQPVSIHEQREQVSRLTKRLLARNPQLAKQHKEGHCQVVGALLDATTQRLRVVEPIDNERRLHHAE